jgi:hypothetical protein
MHTPPAWDTLLVDAFRTAWAAECRSRLRIVRRWETQHQQRLARAFDLDTLTHEAEALLTARHGAHALATDLIACGARVPRRRARPR